MQKVFDIHKIKNGFRIKYSAILQINAGAIIKTL